MSNMFDEQKKQYIESNPYIAHSHIKIETAEQDHAVFLLEVHEDNRNPYGIVHGGALYTLADCVTGAAAARMDFPCVTQNGSLHFLSNQTEGIVRAEARVRHRGKQTCLVSVDLTGENGKLIATGEFTYFRVGTMPLEKVGSHQKLR